ncbi:general secretion pathway protein GspM [Desulfobacter hydrogenophilus]|uniref:General secretion pathway protein GspM n=1 Tax=Desulfobacter hydrogenophilus TaxID=2291 RepID=A0A328FFR4_9BACT|nr:type II secretion system protein M [Desulfobacter hydrogenophilus]NDY70863.1 general secretion pathway protein GspM [Desulfobacter hydrogenophilus]QBH11633.1 general secretion pathway protein GspM [Desulfobacter hydrogenophilus]RAM03179.1 general secretion pathway protein GspM [Desulfobacter hydrogenophilus]
MFELSKRDKKFIAAGTVFLVLFSLVWFVYLPAVDKRAMLEKKVISKARDFEVMQNFEMTWQQYANSFDLEKEALKKRGPKFTLFSFLESLSSKSLVKKNVAYMKPFSQDMENSDYIRSRVTVKLQQVYLKGLVDFLFRIETSPQGVSVISLSLTKSGDKGQFLDAVIETQTLALKGEKNRS